VLSTSSSSSSGGLAIDNGQEIAYSVKFSWLTFVSPGNCLDTVLKYAATGSLHVIVMLLLTVILTLDAVAM
jgi:hypothetical protein